MARRFFDYLLVFAAEEGEFLPLGIKELDVNGRGVGNLTFDAARRCDGRDGFGTVKRLGGSASQAGVRAVVDVVVKCDGGASFEVLKGQGWNDLEVRDAFERFPEAFESCVGVDVFDAAVTMSGAISTNSLAEGLGNEFTTAVSNDVTRLTEVLHGGLEQLSHGLARGPAIECHGGQGHSRVGIEDGGEIELLRGEEVLDLSDVHHPDVVDEVGFDRVDSDVFCLGRSFQCVGSNTSFSLDVTNCFLAELPTCGEKVFGDHFVAAESKAGHALNEMTNGVIEATNGCFGVSEANGLGVGILALFPGADGVFADEEVSCGFDEIPSERFSEFEDLETLRGVVLWPTSFGKFSEASLKQFDDFPRGFLFDFGFLKSCSEVIEAAIATTERAEVGGGGNAQELGCVQNGAIGIADDFVFGDIWNVAESVRQFDGFHRESLPVARGFTEGSCLENWGGY